MKWTLLFLFAFGNIIRGQERESTPKSNFGVLLLDSWSDGRSLADRYDVQNCSEVEIFDSGMDACRVNCSDGETFSYITKTCVDGTVLEYIKGIGHSCKNISLEKPHFTIDQTDGRLYLIRPKDTTIFYPGQYELTDSHVDVCLPYNSEFLTCRKIKRKSHEYEIQNGGLTLWDEILQKSIDIADFIIREDDKTAEICSPPGWIISDFDLFIIHIVIFSISAVFILIALIIYGIIYRTLKYHVKVIICHMISLLIFYICKICFTLHLNVSILEICYTYAVLIHYFLLAAFFWLSVMAYDILRHMPKSVSKEVTAKKMEKYRFVFKSLYAWLCPALIVIAAHMVDHFGPVDSEFRPKFHSCWFSSIIPEAVFLFGPTGLILIICFIFCIITAVNIKKMGKNVMQISLKMHKQLMWLYLKITIIMAICWIADLVAAFVPLRSIYWVIAEVINGLQGFFLFIVYVFTRTVIHDMALFWKKNVASLCAKKDEKSQTYNVSSEKQNVESEIPQYENGINSKNIKFESTYL